MKRLHESIQFFLLALPWVVACGLSYGRFVRRELQDSIRHQFRLFLSDMARGMASFMSWPRVLRESWMSLSWDRLLSVRRGFLLGAMVGFFVAGSMLWAIPAVTSYMPSQFLEPIIPPSSFMPIARGNIPSELIWFFIQFPYVSESSQVRPKNHHTFVISDVPRRRNYVVNFGQRYRRVEIYSQDSTESQVQVFTPGSKRVVFFQGSRVVRKSVITDGNLWMWKGPLWNAEHLKIYGLADLWLDSPYKRYSCAGFVHRFLKDVHVDVPILDAWDLARLPWVRVPFEELEPGDIITMKALTAQHRRFWGHRVTHVGVYIGNGKFIHAATSSPHSKRSWVRIADLDDFRNRIDKIIRPPELL